MGRNLHQFQRYTLLSFSNGFFNFIGFKNVKIHYLEVDEAKKVIQLYANL